MIKEVAVTVPGLFFEEYFSTTGIMTGEETDEDAVALRAVFEKADRVTIGRGYLVRGCFTEDTLALLKEYAEYVADEGGNFYHDNAKLWRSASTLLERIITAEEVLTALVGDDDEEPRVDYRGLSRTSVKACAIAVSRAIRETTGLRPDSSRPPGYAVNDLRVSGYTSGVHVNMWTDEPQNYDTDKTFHKIVTALRGRGFLLTRCTVEKTEDTERASFLVIGKR